MSVISAQHGNVKHAGDMVQHWKVKEYKIKL